MIPPCPHNFHWYFSTDPCRRQGSFVYSFVITTPRLNIMSTSPAGRPNSHRSSDLETIDSLVQTLDKTAALAEDKVQDPLDTLTSSLQAVYVTCGIFDSLTLARGEINPKDSDNGYDLEDDFEEEETTWEQEEGEKDGDEADSVWREFDSGWETSWGNVMKAAPSLIRPGSTRRSGVRRGYQEAADSTKVISVPTKINDGNHKSDSRFHDSTNKNRVVPKQSTPPAA